MQKHHIVQRLKRALAAESVLRVARYYSHSGWIHPDRRSTHHMVLDSLDRAMQPLRAEAREQAEASRAAGGQSGDRNDLAAHERAFRPVTQTHRAALGFLCECLPRPAVPNAMRDRAYKIARWNELGYATQDACAALFGQAMKRAKGHIRALRTARDAPAEDRPSAAAAADDLRFAQAVSSMLFGAEQRCREGYIRRGATDLDGMALDCLAGTRQEYERLERYARPDEPSPQDIERAALEHLGAALPRAPARQMQAEEVAERVAAWNALGNIRQADCIDLFAAARTRAQETVVALDAYCASLAEVAPDLEPTDGDADPAGP